MKSIGIIRGVDRMGRVVIPKEIRNQLGLRGEKDFLEIFTEGDFILLKKFEPTCIFCGKLGENLELSGHSVCRECLEKLNQQIETKK